MSGKVAYHYEGQYADILAHHGWEFEGLLDGFGTQGHAAMVMIGSDHGAAWWVITPLSRKEDEYTYTLYVEDADSIHIDIIRHPSWEGVPEGEEYGSHVVGRINLDYDAREALAPTSGGV